MSTVRKIALAAVAGALIIGATGAAASADTPPALTVSGVTHVTNRPDNGNGGPWALDAFDRKLTVNQQHAVDFAACPKAVQEKLAALHRAICWLYTAEIADSGTFVTLDAPSPNAKVTNTAGLNGTMSGWSKYSFYTTHLVDESLIPAVEQGVVTSTANWYKVAFPQGTTFAGGITDWGWKYKAPGCDSDQEMTDSQANDKATGNEFSGDILTSKNTDCPTPTPTPSDTPTEEPTPTPDVTPTEEPTPEVTQVPGVPAYTG